MAAAAGLPEHAETIARRSRGHTLFVVETLRALAAGEAGAPASLQQVVLARLRRTGPATEELLRAGAVLGATVDPATVADMVGLTPQVAAQRCAVAAAARLLVVAGRNYEFANDLIQEVLYATTPEPTRVAYHRRAAELLSHRPELVATHAVATQDWPLAARALLLAAEEATRRFAIADARDLAERALDAAERGGAAALIAEAYLARGHSWVVRSKFRLAFNDHHAALVAARQAGDTRLEMLALRELGGHAGIAVSMADAAGYLADGLQIAEALGDRGMQARFLDWLAVGSSNRLRFVDALAHGRRAVAIGRASGEDAALAAGLDGLKNAYAYLGWTGELAGVLSELVPLLRRLGDAALLQWAVFESAFAAFGAAEWGTAEGRIGDAITISERSGHDLHAGWFTAYLSWLERLRCRYPTGPRPRSKGNCAHRGDEPPLVRDRRVLAARHRVAGDGPNGGGHRAPHPGMRPGRAGRRRGPPAALPRTAGRGDRLPHPARRGRRVARPCRRARRVRLVARHRRLSCGRPWLAAARRTPPGTDRARSTARRGRPARVGACPGRRCGRRRSGRVRAGRRRARPDRPVPGRGAGQSPRDARNRTGGPGCALRIALRRG